MVNIMKTLTKFEKYLKERKKYKRHKYDAIILACFFGVLSFIYTWKYDKNKFWICILLSILSAGKLYMFIYLYVVLTQMRRPNKEFKQYK